MTTTISEKKKVTGFMISKELLAMLDEKAKVLGISRSEYVRQLVIKNVVDNYEKF